MLYAVPHHGDIPQSDVTSPARGRLFEFYVVLPGVRCYPGGVLVGWVPTDADHVGTDFGLPVAGQVLVVGVDRDRAEHDRAVRSTPYPVAVLSEIFGDSRIAVQPRHAEVYHLTGRSDAEVQAAIFGSVIAGKIAKVFFPDEQQHGVSRLRPEIRRSFRVQCYGGGQGGESYQPANRDEAV